MKVGDLVKYSDYRENPVHVAQNFDLFSVGIIVETCQHWEWAKVMWNNDYRRYRKHYFYQLEVISKKNE